MAEDFLRSAKDGVYIKLRVSPGAKNTGIQGLYGEEAIKLSVAAPPTEGKANKEVERYLAALLGVEKSRVAVVKGTSSRDKLVFVSGAKPETVLKGLELSAVSFFSVVLLEHQSSSRKPVPLETTDNRLQSGQNRGPKRLSRTRIGSQRGYLTDALSLVQDSDGGMRRDRQENTEYDAVVQSQTHGGSAFVPLLKAG